VIIQQRLTIRYFNQSPDSGYFAVNRKFQVQLKYWRKMAAFGEPLENCRSRFKSWTKSLESNSAVEQTKQACIQPPTYADNVALPTCVHRCCWALAMQQVTDISCRQCTQQQTCCETTLGLTDRWILYLHTPCSACCVNNRSQAVPMTHWPTQKTDPWPIMLDPRPTRLTKQPRTL